MGWVGDVYVIASSAAEEGELETEVLMEHRRFPGYRFVLRLAHGRTVALTCSDARFVPRPDGWEPPNDDPGWGPVRSVSATMLRELPYGELERAAKARATADLTYLATSDEVDAADKKRFAAMQESMRGGRLPSRDDLFYAQLARDYVRALRGAAPIKAVAAKWYKAPRTVQNALTEARGRGLLTDSPEPGKPGGQLTSKAKKILREAAKNGGPE